MNITGCTVFPDWSEQGILAFLVLEYKSEIEETRMKTINWPKKPVEQLHQNTDEHLYVM